MTPQQYAEEAYKLIRALEGVDVDHNDRTATIEANERITLLERENELLREQVRLRKELAAASQPAGIMIDLPAPYGRDWITNIGLTD